MAWIGCSPWYEETKYPPRDGVLDAKARARLAAYAFGSQT